MWVAVGDALMERDRGPLRDVACVGWEISYGGLTNYFLRWRLRPHQGDAPIAHTLRRSARVIRPERR